MTLQNVKVTKIHIISKLENTDKISKCQETAKLRKLDKLLWFNIIYPFYQTVEKAILHVSSITSEKK